MILKNGKEIKNGGRPYIVAEMNSSHRGKVDVAKAMIDAAKDCGCDAVKFQSWTADTLYSQDYYEQNPIAKRMVNGFSLSSEALLELSRYCTNIDIDFSSTPYSQDEVDFLSDQCKAPFIKVASMDINNIPFLRYIAKKGLPIVLSTGMADVEEIETAVNAIEKEGNSNICILHCVSLYPANVESVNLNNMVMLKDRFPQHEVGYSDHTIGNEVACAAVALGASLIEKHFTLDNTKVGWDNQMATEPAEMKMLVEKCKNVYKALGSYDRRVAEDELEQREKMRRSIVAAIDLSKGHIISENDITAKRPGDSIPVDEYEKVIGRIVEQDIPQNCLIKDEYLN